MCTKSSTPTGLPPNSSFLSLPAMPVSMQTVALVTPTTVPFFLRPENRYIVIIMSQWRLSRVHAWWYGHTIGLISGRSDAPVKNVSSSSPRLRLLGFARWLTEFVCIRRKSLVMFLFVRRFHANFFVRKLNLCPETQTRNHRNVYLRKTEQTE